MTTDHVFPEEHRDRTIRRVLRAYENNQTYPDDHPCNRGDHNKLAEKVAERSRLNEMSVLWLN